MGKKNIRSNFRLSVFQRDNYTCQVCNKKSTEEFLDAHHITDRNEMPNGGYVRENGITVCKDTCHLKVEKFHITGGVEWESGLHPNDLYLKIKSSYNEALKKSKLLS